MRNIVLTGFMGTGKSTVGRALATALDWPFVDLDDLLEQREGRPIRAIFETEGEAHFRQLEAALCREAAAWQQHVIATGGGALTFAHNRAAFEAENLVICLTCEPELLWERLAAATNRPMLDSEDRKTRLLSLLAARQPAYARIQHQVDTGRRSLAEVVAEILHLWHDLNGFTSPS